MNSLFADYFSSVTTAISLECTVVQQSPTASQSPRDMEENPQDDSPVSKYLTLPPGATPSIPKTMPRARLLTSADAMAQMERKKKQALKEKERRKIEREDKKCQREEEQKRKAEERERENQKNGPKR